LLRDECAVRRCGDGHRAWLITWPSRARRHATCGRTGPAGRHVSGAARPCVRAGACPVPCELSCSSLSAGSAFQTDRSRAHFGEYVYVFPTDTYACEIALLPSQTSTAKTNKNRNAILASTDPDRDLATAHGLQGRFSIGGPVWVGL
jgi:hypothetical protein